MSSAADLLAEIPNLRRIENFPKNDMQALAIELTHAVYPHEEIYGSYFTLQEYIDCDMWPFFYAGHHVELQNLKHILEYRHEHGLAVVPEWVSESSGRRRGQRSESGAAL